jgi:hypothetical protein
MAKRMRMPLTRARSRLFEVAALVRESGDDTAVILDQRGHTEGIALVREAHLQYLEDRVAQMDKKSKPFTVPGSLSSSLKSGELEALLKELRKAWAPAGRTYP